MMALKLLSIEQQELNILVESLEKVKFNFKRF